VRLFAAAASVALLLVPSASAAIFGKAADIPLGKQPVTVAIGDATGDSLPDIVTANASVPGMTILPGRGDGSFEKPIKHGEVSGARAFAFGDFDTDGSEDLAVAIPSAILIYSTQDGDLVRRRTLAVPASSALATGDIDSDGNPDLVAVSATRQVVTVLHGNGDGTFEAPVDYPVGEPASSLVLADLTGDEFPDIVVAGPRLSELASAGDGFFEPYQLIPGPGGLRSVAADDLDSDSDIDLVGVGGQNQAFAFLNDGEGGFTASSTYRTGLTPVAAALADVDSDGSPDLLTVNRGSNDLSILRGVDNGTLLPQIRVKLGRTPVALSVGDFDQDGRFDLVVANKLSKSVTVLINGRSAPQPTVCLVPRVVKQTLAVARANVIRGHCTLGAVRRKYSKRIRRGRVIAQSPVPGVRAPEDAPVALVVSRGPKKR